MFVEERAETARLALRVRSWPTVEDLLALVDWLRPAVRVYEGAPVRQALLLRTGAGALVALPGQLRQSARVAVHEVAHWLLGHGAADYLRQTLALEAGGSALVRREEHREEAEAEAFVAAFLLPPDLCRISKSVAAVMAETNLPEEMVTQRMRTLPRRWTGTPNQPVWCAARDHVIECGPAVGGSRITVRARDYPDTCWETTVAAADWLATRYQWHADLLALTTDEWREKYRAFHVEGQRRCYPVEIATLWRWMQGTAA